MSVLKATKTRKVKLADLVPYADNPRRIPPEAVAAVKSSIEKYGYRQPIVVDRSNVVVVGHTRLAALLELGVETAEVMVSSLPEEKLREYRVVDNRVGELGQWDHSALVVELREFDSTLLADFFPDVDLEIDSVTKAVADVTEQQVADAVKHVSSVPERKETLLTSVVCPACFEPFQVGTASLPGLTRLDLEALAAAATAADDGRAE